MVILDRTMGLGAQKSVKGPIRVNQLQQLKYAGDDPGFAHSYLTVDVILCLCYSQRGELDDELGQPYVLQQPQHLITQEEQVRADSHGRFHKQLTLDRPYLVVVL